MAGLEQPIDSRPRAMVRSGFELGPWLSSPRISVISNVSTLSAMWDLEHLVSVRLIIFGGEACPIELKTTRGPLPIRSARVTAPQAGAVTEDEDGEQMSPQRQAGTGVG